MNPSGRGTNQRYCEAHASGTLLCPFCRLHVRFFEVPFWKPNKKPAQDALQCAIFERLIASRLIEMGQVEALVDKLMELARANHHRLMQA